MAQSPDRPVILITMKIHLTPSLLMAAALVACSALMAEDAKKESVSVAFHESDKFTDARSSFGGETDKHYLDTLATHLKKSAERRLAPGQKLEVTFTDIDLAGDFVPTNANAHDVRVIRDIWIPRQKLTFRLLDEQGQVIKEGERRLTDLNFMNNPGLIGRSEPLFYDKALLTDWIAKELKS
ncbi:DUF3016 domain-containing protein [Oleiharenicola lentus]|jgi:hypothetical protein|uniref:DUF3016 domain-containing protein n=2 Tax=Oleiharenicola lentus TaxID=2508720 RepID=A0A4Q1CAN7_9BACT|nr:DUF3016 domain-containing protein [Oleiharenicola lentus]